MIVKNEEDWVVGAVESVRSIADEVIIVDTGSTDSTLERAASLDATLLKTRWKGSFSEARNLTLDHAKHEWILVLDADERIARQDLPYIQGAVKSDRYAGFHLVLRNYAAGNQVFGWVRNNSDYQEGAAYGGYVDAACIRLFRNSRGIRFTGAVHEIIDPKRLSAHSEFDSIPAVIHHYGNVRDAERLRAKRRSYITLGLKKLEADPENPQAYFELGIQYQELGRHAEACACFDQTFEMNRSPLAVFYWGVSEKQLQHYESAEGLLNLAARLGLDTAEMHLEIGNVYLEQGHLKKAGIEYENCMSFMPQSPVAALRYGLVLRKLGEEAEAAKLFELALTLDPRFVEPRIELAILHLKAQRPDEALSLLGNAEGAVALSLRGAAHLQKDNLDEAQTCLESALKKDQSLLEARANLVKLLLRKGDHARAKRAQSRNP